jgi:hypothetical protein
MRRIFILSPILFLCLIKQVFSQPVINVDPSQSVNLNAIINSATPGTWIVFADGTYTIPDYIAINVNNITLTSSSGNPESVIINGNGMNGDNHGFLVYSNNITISHMTIQNVRYNCISLAEDIDGLHIDNCILRDAGEFFVDVSWTSALSPSENGIVENCIFEYSAGIGVNTYMGGINGKFCKDWIIKNNVFRSIRSPSIGISVYAILFWSGSEANLVERNHIINCDRGIGFGLLSYGNSGGVIRNNFIYHENILENDQGGIILETSPYTQVYNNTIYIEQNVTSSIEYRFNVSIEIFIANNLTNQPILARDGATATDTNNVTVSSSSWFVDITIGDLHLSSDTLPEVIDQGIAITGLTEDFDGDSRPQGLGIEIGADEYISNTDIKRFNNKGIIPATVELNQNYPNPFNPSTIIKFNLPKTSHVTLKVFNILGEEVATLVSDRLSAGSYSYEWDASNLASGVYLYRLQAGDYVETRKMVLMR